MINCTRLVPWLLVIILILFPEFANACACGCGVFDVGTGTMLPTGEGGSVWMEYDYMNQSENWSGLHQSAKALNDDKQIRTDFYTFGTQYMFNRNWGTEVEIPFLDRHFKTTDDSGNSAKYHHADFGDIRIKGIYSGFSEDMSSGITYGLKLPTASYHHEGFDRDTDLGSGSTDLLFGVYHMGNVLDSSTLKYFVNGQWEQAVMLQNNYRPGDELNIAVGLYYDSFRTEQFGKISPILQFINSSRMHDRGQNADPDNSGYERMLLSPGIEYDIDDMRLYGDVAIPIFQNVNGNQLTAPILFKFIVGYNF